MNHNFIMGRSDVSGKPCLNLLMVHLDEKHKFAARLNSLFEDSTPPIPRNGRGSYLMELIAKNKGKITNKGVNNWLNGESLPRDAFIKIIAAHFGVTPQWLRYGEGEKLATGRPKSDSGVPIVGTTQSGPPPRFIDSGYPRSWPGDEVSASGYSGQAYALTMSAAHASLHAAIATTKSLLVVDPAAPINRSVIMALQGDAEATWLRVDSVAEDVIRGADYLRPQIIMEIPRKAIAYAHAVVRFVP